MLTFTTSWILFLNIDRVLKPNTGMIRIGERSGTSYHPEMKQMVINSFQNEYNMTLVDHGPTRTSTNNKDIFHLLSPDCLGCARAFFDPNNKKINEWGLCWVCHVEFTFFHYKPVINESKNNTCAYIDVLFDNGHSVLLPKRKGFTKWYVMYGDVSLSYWAVEGVKGNNWNNIKPAPNIQFDLSNWPFFGGKTDNIVKRIETKQDGYAACEVEGCGLDGVANAETSVSQLPEVLPVLVVGAGPRGLAFATSMGKVLRRQVIILEAGEEAGEYIRSWHDWAIPRSPINKLAIFPEDATRTAMGECTTTGHGNNRTTYVTCSREEYVAYLSRIARSSEQAGYILVRWRAQVVRIAQDKPGQYHSIYTSDGRVFFAKHVVLATGRFSVPRQLEEGITMQGVRFFTAKGFRRSLLSHLTPEPKHALVVGSGVSALEIVEGLLTDGLVQVVTLCYRSKMLKESHNHPSTKLYNMLKEFIVSGKLLVRKSTSLISANATHAVVKHHVEPTPSYYEVPADFIVSAVGFVPNASFFTKAAGIELWSDNHSLLHGQPVLRRLQNDGSLSKPVIDVDDQWGETSVRNIYALLSDGGKVGNSHEIYHINLDICSVHGAPSNGSLVLFRKGGAALVEVLAKQLCG